MLSPNLTLQIKQNNNNYIKMDQIQEKPSKTVEESQSEYSYQLEKDAYQNQVDHSKTKAGTWKTGQSLSYHKFLIKNKALITNQKKRRTKRVFEKMSQDIGTKTAAQCRSHHQKAMGKYGNLQNLLKFSSQFAKLHSLSHQKMAKNEEKLEATCQPRVKLQRQIQLVQVQDMPNNQQSQFIQDIWGQQLGELNFFSI